jgi:tetratricopeptide (TPR) repeat protein
MSQWRNADPKIGEAWAMHRDGRNRDAIARFEEALMVVPHSADAHYGLGLALRAEGDTDRAIEMFKKSYEIAQRKLESIRSLDDVDDNIANNLDTTEDDRYMMLSRMIHQRLAELGELEAPTSGIGIGGDAIDE